MISKQSMHFMKAMGATSVAWDLNIPFVCQKRCSCGMKDIAKNNF
jgi:hypothetical protein